MLDAALRLAQEVAPICGDPASWLCEIVLETTGNTTLARGADVLIAAPGRILLILVLAVLATSAVRRLVKRLVERMREPGATGKFGQAVGRTVGRTFFEDRPELAARRRQRADAIGGLARGAAVFIIWTLAGFLILDELGLNIGPLIAGAGVIGLAIGFGAQNLVRDLLSGIFMLVEDQYGVGDVVDVGVTSGVVESVGLRVTRLRDVNGVLWHVPNGTIEAVGNMSQEWSRALLDVQVAYGTDVEHAKRVIKGVADELWRDDPAWSEAIIAEPEIWGVEALGADGITIRLVLRTKPLEQWNTARELRARLVSAFERAGITIPYPQRMVWLRPADEEPARPTRERTEEAAEVSADTPTPTPGSGEPDAAEDADRMPPPEQSPGPDATSTSEGERGS